MWIPSARLGHVGPSVFKSSCPTWHNSQDNLPEPGQDLSATRCAEQTTEMPRWRPTCSSAVLQPPRNPLNFHSKIAGDSWRLWMLIPKKIGFVWICGIVGVDPSPNDHLTSLGFYYLSAWAITIGSKLKGLQNHQDTYFHSKFGGKVTKCHSRIPLKIGNPNPMVYYTASFSPTVLKVPFWGIHHLGCS
jgi:hypothetical protein